MKWSLVRTKPTINGGCSGGNIAARLKRLLAHIDPAISMGIVVYKVATG